MFSTVVSGVLCSQYNECFVLSSQVYTFACVCVFGEGKGWFKQFLFKDKQWCLQSFKRKEHQQAGAYGVLSTPYYINMTDDKKKHT